MKKKKLKILVILLISLVSTSLVQIFSVRYFNSQEVGPSPTPMSKRSTTPSRDPTPTAIQESVIIDQFQYPDSIVLQKDNEKLNLESLDDTQKITDWYKEKIRSMGMNAKTFVQTKTNGVILNKLAGADMEKEIAVEISKQKDQSVTIISVEITNVN